MSGLYWPVFIFTIVFVFIALMVYRVLKIIKMPVHLRWELAPIPHDKERYSHGGSYLEEHEWWRRKQPKAFFPIITYMAWEIFLMKGVWQHNRGLWPFSFTLHWGIYLVILSLFFHFINAMLLIGSVPAAVQDVFFSIASVVAVTGYCVGLFGVVGLILKRYLDKNYREYSSYSTYFKLLFLAAIFVSGIVAWALSNDFANALGVFTRDLFTVDSGITTTAAMGSHIIIIFLFILYLPFTDMVHFITKFFTHHSVRWDDSPQNEKMTAKLRDLINQPVTWSAPHVKSNRGNRWGDIVEKEND
ncbi:MAG: respiratory nitrate reductase subunit gamma [Dehalococcoidales bacterium]|nr:respiratory nitrate reductase subunit gamma [Dehalococcoidales bacterium]